MWKEKWISLLPKSLLLFLARPYLGGYSIEDALKKAKKLWEKGLYTTIDLLGEEVKTTKKAEENCEIYLKLLESISLWEEEKSRPSVSLKLSSLTTYEKGKNKISLDRDLLEKHLRKILEEAKQRQIQITIDMEDHYWTDITLELYKKYVSMGHLGTVLQSRLFRTAQDIEEIPTEGRIRLCIGIYREPPEIAYQDKKIIKEKMLEYGKKLLDRGIYLEFATHDERLLRRFFEEIYRPEEHQNKVEVQMLLGVPREKTQQALRSGNFIPQVPPIPVRIYLPFAEHEEDAYAYLQRRLIENPHIFAYGFYNMFRRVRES